MPGFILHVGASVVCAHAGQAQPLTPNPRVMLSGQPSVTIASAWLLAGCTMPPPNAGNGPCVSAQFTTAATRVTCDKQPLLLLDSQSTCAPTGTPLMVLATQARVFAQ